MNRVRTPAPLDVDAAATHSYRWVMFGGMVLVYFAFGMVVSSIPPMITEVREDLGMGRGAMGLALAAWTFMYIGTAPLAGRAVDRLGIKWSLALGGLSLTLTSVARSFATGTVSLWLAVAIMGIGGPLVSAAAPTLCGRWFADDRERRLTVSTYNLGPGIGSILTIFATNSILLPWLGDWRAVIRFEAAVAAVATLVWIAICLRAPARGGHRTSTSVTPLLQEWSLLLRSSDVRHALLLGALTFFVSHSLNNWMVDALSERADITINSAAQWISGAGLIGMGLLFVVPKLTGRFGRVHILFATWAILVTGMVLVAWGAPALTLVGAVLTGTRGIMVPLLIMSVMSARGVNETNMGAANGLWFSSAQIGGVTGPWVVGLIADSRAGFTGALSLLAIVGATAALLAISRRSPASPDSPASPVSSP